MLEHFDIRNLANTNYQFFRRLIELMPVDVLCHARQTNAQIQHYSQFRGDFVESLMVGYTETVEFMNINYITYSEFINRPLKVTPTNQLIVKFEPHTDAKAVVARMDSKISRSLTVVNHYNWRQVLDLLHPNLDHIILYDTLELPVNEATEFFTALFGYAIPMVNMLNGNYNDNWVFKALDVSKKLGMASSFVMDDEWNGYYLYFTGTDDVTLEMRIVHENYEELDSDDDGGVEDEAESEMGEEEAAGSENEEDEEGIEESDEEPVDENIDFDDLPINNDVEITLIF